MCVGASIAFLRTMKRRVRALLIVERKLTERRYDRIVRPGVVIASGRCSSARLIGFCAVKPQRDR